MAPPPARLPVAVRAGCGWDSRPHGPQLTRARGDRQITNPAGQYEKFDKSVSNGDFTFEAKHDGKFVYCFGNEHWGASSKEVSFNVHGVVYVSEADAPQDPLEAEVRRLSDLLELVRDEQSYIVVRERTHRNTAESTNSRVKWWNLFVIGVVVGESVFQVWWLRRFFEVSRTGPGPCMSRDTSFPCRCCRLLTALFPTACRSSESSEISRALASCTWLAGQTYYSPQRAP